MTLAELLALAKHPNIAVKATGAPGHSSAGLSVPEYPRRAAAGFSMPIGPERFFWGTDITRMPCAAIANA